MFCDDESRSPTRRPLSRPVSARVNRELGAWRHGAALRQIKADQDAALEHAAMLRHRNCKCASQELAQKEELRASQAEAFREKQRELTAMRADAYYSEDARRNEEMRAKSTAAYNGKVQALSNLQTDRICRAEINKAGVRSSERTRFANTASEEAHRMNEAAQHRADWVESVRERERQKEIKRAELMQRFAERQQQEITQRAASDIMKQMQRTQHRVLQLQADKRTWQVACEEHTATEAARLIDEKLQNEVLHLADLAAAVQDQPQKQRPRSAGIPSSIPKFSQPGANTPRRVNTPRAAACRQGYDARARGPRICKIDPRIGVAYG